MKIFDSHCHLDDKSYKRDLERILDRARSAGVTRLMSIGGSGVIIAIILISLIPVFYEAWKARQEGVQKKAEVESP